MVGASQLALIGHFPSTECDSEVELLAACWRREMGAFERLYRTHGPTGLNERRAVLSIPLTQPVQADQNLDAVDEVAAERHSGLAAGWLAGRGPTLVVPDLFMLARLAIRV